MANNANKKTLFKEILKLRELENGQVMDATKILSVDPTKLNKFFMIHKRYRKEYIFSFSYGHMVTEVVLFDYGLVRLRLFSFFFISKSLGFYNIYLRDCLSFHFWRVS